MFTRKCKQLLGTTRDGVESFWAIKKAKVVVLANQISKVFYFIKIKAVVRWSTAGKIAAMLSSLNNTKLALSSSARLKIKLNCSQGRSVWIMERCAPRGKELFVVCPNVRSGIRGESASLSRSRLPVNDNPMEWPIWAGWSAASNGRDKRGRGSCSCSETVWADKAGGRNRLRRLCTGCGSKYFKNNAVKIRERSLDLVWINYASFGLKSLNQALLGILCAQQRIGLWTSSDKSQPEYYFYIPSTWFSAKQSCHRVVLSYLNWGNDRTFHEGLA